MMPFGKFLMFAIPLGGLALFLAFGKIKGFPAPTVLARSLSFVFTGKVYVWHQKGEQAALPTIKKATPAQEIQSKVPLTLYSGSKLGKLKKIIEING
jgi:hypothetical protein